MVCFRRLCVHAHLSVGLSVGSVIPVEPFGEAWVSLSPESPASFGSASFVFFARGSCFTYVILNGLGVATVDNTTEGWFLSLLVSSSEYASLAIYTDVVPGDEAPEHPLR